MMTSTTDLWKSGAALLLLSFAAACGSPTTEGMSNAQPVTDGGNATPVYEEDREGVGEGGSSTCAEPGATIPGFVLAENVCGPIRQTVCGSFTHAGKYSIDIAINYNTSVVSPAGGTVVTARSNIPDTCSYPNLDGRDALRLTGECPETGTDYGNYIAIAPDDPNLPSLYVAHLKEGGVDVVLGEHVTQGQVIGHSGSTGFSTASHLHFGCVTRGSESGTFPTAACSFTWRARDSNAVQTGQPEEGDTVCGLAAGG